MFQNIQSSRLFLRVTKIRYKREENMAANAAKNIISLKIFTPLLCNARYFKRWESAKLKTLYRRNKAFQSNTDPKELLELQRRSGYIEWNREAEIYAFGKRLQEDFRLDLLDLAFTHRSYIVKEKGRLEAFNVETEPTQEIDNGKLIEMGERIISEYVWNYFSYFFPKFPLEGIASVTDHLTSIQVLSHISKNLGTSDIILSQDYPVEDVTLAKTLQAIVGALKESQGIERSNTFVRDLIVTQFCGKDINDFLYFQNYFEILCEILKRDGYDDPEPRIICQTAVTTILANYHIGIYLNKKFLGHGSGESVDIAIDMAALDVLKRFFGTTDSDKPLRYDADLNFTGKINHNLPLSEWSLSKINGKR